MKLVDSIRHCPRCAAPTAHHARAPSALAISAALLACAPALALALAGFASAAILLCLPGLAWLARELLALRPAWKCGRCASRELSTSRRGWRALLSGRTVTSSH